jgi:NAD(P)-dependent dehydrogenase (short-subunit alcohol dehydrogenase family)
VIKGYHESPDVSSSTHRLQIRFQPLNERRFVKEELLDKRNTRMVVSRSIIIVGVGPFISTSLARRLAIEGWNIALLSRSQDKLLDLAEELSKHKTSDAKIFTKAVDAGNAAALVQALEESKSELGSVDVVCYNAARVGEWDRDSPSWMPTTKLTRVQGADDLMTLKSETLGTDFKVSAVGTLVTGQWLARNADTSRVSSGEYPMLLVTGGLLHKVRVVFPGRLAPVRFANTSSIQYRPLPHFQRSSPHHRTLPPAFPLFSPENSTCKWGNH